MAQTPTPGEACWVDLSSPDPAASAAFYGPLLGWEVTAPQPELGGYATFHVGGRKAAGVMPLMAPDQPATWTAYVCTDDADATAARVQEAGGAVLVPPMDVADLGRMTIFADPAGAVLGAWQPQAHQGSELGDQPGGMAWLELTTAAVEPVSAFYSAVFGWDTRTSEAYVELTREGTSVAGVADPEQGTHGWLTYFRVADPRAVAEQAQALGGSVVLPHTTFHGGSCAVLRDPHGVEVGVIAFDG